MSLKKWHGWSSARKQEHLKKFREYTPKPTDLFEKPSNSGRKPGYNQRKRKNASDVEMVMDRTESQPKVYIIPYQDEAIRFQDPRYFKDIFSREKKK